MRNPGCFLFLVLLCSSCVSSPEEKSSGDLSFDTSYYIPDKSISDLIKKNRPHTDTVEIVDMKFQPEEIKVNKGDTIIWVNHDLVNHCVTEESKGWTSSAIPGGSSWKMVVSSAANYYCAIHLVMKGRIALND